MKLKCRCYERESPKPPLPAIRAWTRWSAGYFDGAFTDVFAAGVCSTRYLECSQRYSPRRRQSQQSGAGCDHRKNAVQYGFRIKPNGCYILVETITIPPGKYLTIIAPEPGQTQETAPPQVVWSSSSEMWRDVYYFKHTFMFD